MTGQWASIEQRVGSKLWRVHRRWLLATVFWLLMLAPVGCTRTVVGGYVTSPDSNYVVYGRIYGAYGQSFTNETAKMMRLTIATAGRKKATLLREEFSIRGADVGWDAAWDSSDNLKVVLYEYPVGVNRWAVAKIPRTNHIRTLYYRFDSKRGTFTEDSAK
jgi:hypothetical protein